MRTYVLFCACFVVLGGCTQPDPSARSKPEVRDATESGFVAIFDGKTLAGWHVEKAERQGDWIVEDGVIIGENPGKKGSKLWTDKEYVDFDLVLDFKTPSSYYDSGIYVRGKTHQIQIGISGSLKIDLTGCIYAPKDRAKNKARSKTKDKYVAWTDKVEAVNKPGEWNKLRILLRGKRITTFLNDEPFVDYVGKVIPDKGPIGIQLHSGHHMKMLFRNINIKELDPAERPKTDAAPPRKVRNVRKARKASPPPTQLGKFVPLFDGKTLTGWEKAGGDLFNVAWKDAGDDLAKGVLSEKLRRQFQKQKITLPYDVTITPEEKGKKWRITAKAKTYTAEKRAEKLYISAGATFRVEDGHIIGERGPGKNTFLCTERTFGDFILKLDIKLDVPCNSGIQLRSHKRHTGRVFGYQCEIDPKPRAWSGGIYDEGNRGWLYSLEGKEAARKAFRVEGWNHYEMQLIGPSIKTWVNGVPCADLLDTAEFEGFIALQVHSGKKGKIRWRNILLKDLGRSEWQPLWNGKDFDGWDQVGGGQWAVEDGVIRGTSVKTEKRHGHLITKKQFGDFAVRLKYKVVQGNSGLYFRVGKDGRFGVIGFQAEIDPNRDAGGLYETAGRGWVAKPAERLGKRLFTVPWTKYSGALEAGELSADLRRQFKKKKSTLSPDATLTEDGKGKWRIADRGRTYFLIKSKTKKNLSAYKPKRLDLPGKWNELSVVALGGRVVVHLNGSKTVELLDDPGRRRGYIALQLHGGQDMDISFKDIEILEIAAAK